MQVVSGQIALFGAIHNVWPPALVKVYEAGRLIRKGVMLHRSGPSVKDARSTTAEARLNARCYLSVAGWSLGPVRQSILDSAYISAVIVSVWASRMSFRRIQTSSKAVPGARFVF
jgi:hypothetical protein